MRNSERFLLAYEKILRPFFLQFISNARNVFIFKGAINGIKPILVSKFIGKL